MGKFKDKNGYVRIRVDDHDRAYFGSVHEHILVMEKYLGRPLPEGTVVHHRNRIRSDNSIENLLLLRCEDDHWMLHRAMERNDVAIVSAYENWSKDFMAKLKAGLPEEECFASSVNISEQDKEKLVSEEKAPVKEGDYKRRLALQDQLFEELRKARKKFAEENNLPAYIVFHDKTLKEMAEIMPESEFSMSQIHGVGAEKLRLYGSCFIDVILKFKSEFGPIPPRRPLKKKESA